MRRAAIAVAWLAMIGVAPAAEALPRACTARSWFAGTTNICRGVLDYRDYVYDDYGADTGAVFTPTTGDLSPSAGDQRYPPGEHNTADLVRLKLWISHRHLHIWGLMNTLYDSRSTILAVAIGHPGATGGRWPGLDVSSRDWEKVYELAGGNPATGVIQGVEPLPAALFGHRARLRVQAVAAQSNGTVMNVAFRGPNEHARFARLLSGGLSSIGSWFEEDQAAALRSGDISRFGYTVTVADLCRHATRVMHVGPGLHERVYTSAYTLGKGISDAGIPGRGNGGGQTKAGFEQSFAYLGRYQPYGIYIPPGGPPYGLQMYYHGTGGNFSSQINQPGMQLRFGNQLHRLLVAPEARGPNGYSADISERDELDVMNDAEANFRIDKTQVFSSGYSQGGYVAYFWAEEHPQLFAGVVSWVGFTGDEFNGTPLKGKLTYTAGAVGNVLDFVPSLLNTPTFMLYSGADELVHVDTAVGMDQAFKATPNIYTWYLHPAAEHLTLIALDDWRKEAAATRGLRLVSNPVHVVFVRDPVTDSPAYGIAHDRAYWISRIRDRRAAGYGTVDLTSHGCGGTVPKTVTGTGAGIDPVPWISNYRRRVGTLAIAVRPTLTGALKNVASLRIDASATCLRRRAVTFDITTDAAVRIRFNDGRTLSLGGAGRHAGRLPR